jgi:hypothetical protein
METFCARGDILLSGDILIPQGIIIVDLVLRRFRRRRRGSVGGGRGIKLSQVISTLSFGFNTSSIGHHIIKNWINASPRPLPQHKQCYSYALRKPLDMHPLERK